VTVHRGIDPRRFALLAFGGAGPLHAVAIARELGISHVVCPRASGVLAALGLVVAPRRRDAARTVMIRGDDLTADELARRVGELGDRARGELGEPTAHLAAVYELRYRGQSFELATSASISPSPSELRASFEALHEERYGYRDPDAELELVTIRVTASVPGAAGTLASSGGDEPSGGPGGGPQASFHGDLREVTIDGERVRLRTLQGVPEPGSSIAGPAIVEMPGSTLLVPPGWDGEVDASASIHLSERR